MFAVTMHASQPPEFLTLGSVFLDIAEEFWLDLTMRTFPVISAVFLAALFTSAPFQNAPAGSATWDLDPTSGDWNTSANWTPATVPNGPADIASFALSSITDISLSADINVDQIVFNPAASAFAITTGPFKTLTFIGGITNNSGVRQNFVVQPSNQNSFESGVVFTGTSTAGSNTAFTLQGATVGGVNYQGGVISFADSATAGNAAFECEGAAVQNGGGGIVVFGGSSTAGTATLVTNPALAAGLTPRGTVWFPSASADNCTITNNGATQSHLRSGLTLIEGESTAGNATLIANGGLNGGLGGEIRINPC